MTDTWGIPGPTFLLYFVTAIVAASIVATIARRIIFAGPSIGALAPLTPQQVAYLNGGADRAVCASVTVLRAAGALGSEAGGVMAATGSMPAGATSLDAAIHHAAGRRTKAQNLKRDPWVVPAVDQLRQGLEQYGYATTSDQRATARVWALLPGGVVLLGVARLFAGAANGKPVGALLLLLIVAFVAAVVALVKANRRATFSTTRALRQIRTDSRHLSPQMTPSLTTYGATAAAMGVAVFGAASLYAMDPAFAAEAEIQRMGAGGPLGSGSGGGSCGGGSSCGGGGCGGGCGG
ncbi:TIGR04222 domain-containing membrane protein [Actinoplanes sp. NPDC089786]|uniref:TIGR04222 domain-containing membrane protein n=1 Tax=Actinoplanes sp. NPDC089786 TaxID=3155185 RepID=UPI003421F9F0